MPDPEKAKFGDRDEWKLLEYAWKYFDRHAEQRLKTFNFYLLLCGATLAGTCAVLQKADLEWLAALLQFILSAVSFVFWKLDARTKKLTKHSENALKLIEDKMPLDDESPGVPHRCKLFRREEYDRKNDMPHEYSYSRCFGLVFCLFGIGSLIFASGLLLTYVPK